VKSCDICKQLLDHYGAEDDHFLERIVMGHETWIHLYESESKRQSMGRKRPHLSAKQKFKTHLTAGKLLITVFGTHKGYCWYIIKKGVQQ
jgi:hypothetical protein